MAWNLEDPPSSPQEKAIYKYVLKQSNDKEFAQSVSKFVGLRTYLDEHPFSSSEELRKNVLSNGTPIFSRHDAEEAYILVSTQKGGVAPATHSVEDVDLIDNIIRQWITFIHGWTPEFVTNITDSFTPYIFILKTLEYNPAFGPLVGMALDSVTAILPVISTTIENLSPELIGLLPIPEAGPVGAIIGWMVASVFVVLSMLIHISRQHFGQAFIISFSLIPFVGSSLYNAAMSGEKFLKKTASRRQKLIDTSRNIFGDPVANVLDGLIPDLLAPPPADFAAAPVQLPTFDDLKNKATGLIGNMVPHDLTNKATNLIGNMVPQHLKDKAQLAATMLTQPSAPVVQQPAPIVEQPAPVVEQPPTAGKRLSRKKHKKSKWRTQKRSRR